MAKFCLLVLSVSLAALKAVDAGSCINTLPPALCNDDSLQECVKDKDADGCPTGNFCFPKTSPDGCAQGCPPICEANQMYCPGVKADGATCPAADTCIDKTGPAPLNCPNFCPIECPAGQKQCDGVRTPSDPCLPQPVCVPTGTDCPTQTVDVDGCDIIDPADEPTCTDGKIVCDGGWDANGCKKPKVCKDPIASPIATCAAVCPAACHEGVETPCSVVYDINGCPQTQVCARYDGHCPENKNIKDDGCPILKTPVCGADEKSCPQDDVLKTTLASDPALVTNPNAVCQLPTKCIPRNIPGTLCENTCKRNCEVADPNGTGLLNQQKCKGARDNKGCRADDFCQPIGSECPAESFDESGCPINPAKECEAEEEKCTGLFQRDGCQLQATCIPLHGDCTCPDQTNDAQGCPIDVPNPTCQGDETKCPMRSDSLGCDLGKECLKAKDKNDCPTICPLHCDLNGKLECTETMDKDTGCPATKNCISAMMKTAGKEHCPNNCPVFCGSGLKECVTYTNQGCPVPKCIDESAECVQTFDESGCEIKAPANCPADQTECPGGTDAEGCALANYCRTSDQTCDAACDLRTEKPCKKGSWDTQDLGQFCIDKSAYSNVWEKVTCETHCPVACDWKTQTACHGGFSKTTGCPLQDSCQDKGIPCADGSD